jgi:hypothetical protein
MTVSLVLAGIPVCGVKVAVLPQRCHVPATAGDSQGSGSEAISGSLKVTVTLSAPSTSRLPLAGVTETPARGGVPSAPAHGGVNAGAQPARRDDGAAGQRRGLSRYSPHSAPCHCLH